MTRRGYETVIPFFGMQLIPLAYGLLYLVHSFRTRRRGQVIAIAVLLLLLLSSLTVLLWEFLAAP